MSKITFKNATLEDANQILQIYQPYIENTTVTMAIQVPTIENYKKVMQKIIEHLAFVVAEIDHEIIGYAFANHFQEKRQAYKYTCIINLYINPSYYGTGLGQQLYENLEQKLKQIGIVQLYSNLTASNIAGYRFLQKNDYTVVGQMPKFGYKFDEWHDILWMAKTIQSNT